MLKNLLLAYSNFMTLFALLRNNFLTKEGENSKKIFYLFVSVISLL